jgi:hypothetical protein
VGERFSAGRALHRLGRLDEAYELYEFFLAHSEDCDNLEHARTLAREHEQQILAERPDLAGSDAVAETIHGEPDQASQDSGDEMTETPQQNVAEADSRDGALSAATEVAAMAELWARARIGGRDEVTETFRIARVRVFNSYTDAYFAVRRLHPETDVEDSSTPSAGLHPAWWVVGAGGAILLGGLVFDLVEARDLRDETYAAAEARDQAWLNEATSNVDDGQVIEALAYGTGLAAVAGGIIWLALDEPAQAMVGYLPNGARWSVSVSTRF